MSTPPPLLSERQKLSQPAAAPAMGDSAGMRILMPVDRSSWAVAAGYLGLFSVLVLPAIFAIIIGFIALVDIRKSRDTEHPKHGMGRAVFAIIMGIACPLLFFLFILQLS